MDGQKLLESVKWNSQGLVPAIAQDIESGEVLMMAWMNEEALNKTLATRQVTYYSRSRQCLWTKAKHRETASSLFPCSLIATGIPSC